MFRYLVLAALFFVLSPGNFLTLPRGGSKRMVAFVHAVVFVVAYYLSEKVAEMLNVKDMEGFRSELGPTMNAPTMNASKSFEAASVNLHKFANECDRIKREKDTEYYHRGDNSPRFRDLDRQQGAACDKANDAINKLRDLLRSHGINESTKPSGGKDWSRVFQGDWMSKAYNW
jgi:hypothetical protein